MPVQRPPFLMSMNAEIISELSLKASGKFNPDKEPILPLPTTKEAALLTSLQNGFDSVELPICERNGPLKLTKTRLHNVIPYPDHNYGQQPPLTPPCAELSNPTVKIEEKPLLLQVSTKHLLSKKLLKGDDAKDGFLEGVTQCICGFSHDDGYMICCDNCSSWQHVECMGIKSTQVPEKYLCHRCSPRELDVDKAKAIQTKKREAISDDEEEEEEEEESGSDEERTLYTAISNTPTRITLTANTSTVKKPIKGAKGRKVQRRKLSDSRNSRRRTRKKGKDSGAADESFVFYDGAALEIFLGNYKSYTVIEENQYDDAFKNMHFQLSDAVSNGFDFKKDVQCHSVVDVSENRKGLVAVCDIAKGSFLIEYKGLLMPAHMLEMQPMFKRCCPYVVHYNRIEQLPLVIDARYYGNDARFLRRSCQANTEFQHCAMEGKLHIIVVSTVDILKEQEITIPFDFPLNSYAGYLECACSSAKCSAAKLNEAWNALNAARKLERDARGAFVRMNSVNNEVMKPLGDGGEIPRGDLDPNGVDDATSRQDKLSREERKLQAYLKQIEKMEKKDVEKRKIPKVIMQKSSSADDSPIQQGTLTVQKATPAKKLPINKRKVSIGTKRRTRQSSCSSEPVSPADTDNNGSSVSTPTTPQLSSVTMHPPSADQSSTLLTRQRARNSSKDSQVLTLTTERANRKSKSTESCASPTASVPTTPVQLSPAGVGNIGLRGNVVFPSQFLSVDTSLQTGPFANSILNPYSQQWTPLKNGIAHGLLQIAPHQADLISPVSQPVSTVAQATSEESVGDAVSRERNLQLPSPVTLFARQDQHDSKYFGSLKKRWFQQHRQQATPEPARPGSDVAQKLTLAALVATLSCRQYVRDTLTPTFKRPDNLVPLKKRRLQEALKQTRCSFDLRQCPSERERLAPGHASVCDSADASVEASACAWPGADTGSLRPVFGKASEHSSPLPSDILLSASTRPEHSARTDDAVSASSVLLAEGPLPTVSCGVLQPVTEVTSVFETPQRIKLLLDCEGECSARSSVGQKRSRCDLTQEVEVTSASSGVASKRACPDLYEATGSNFIVGESLSRSSCDFSGPHTGVDCSDLIAEVTPSNVRNPDSDVAPIELHPTVYDSDGGPGIVDVAAKATVSALPRDPRLSTSSRDSADSAPRSRSESASSTDEMVKLDADRSNCVGASPHIVSSAMTVELVQSGSAGKKKLSFNEYRNRLKLQKSSNSIMASSNVSYRSPGGGHYGELHVEPKTPSYAPVVSPTSPVSVTSRFADADALLIPRTVCLSSTPYAARTLYGDRRISYDDGANFSASGNRDAFPVDESLPDGGAGNDASCRPIFEPVSPGEEEISYEDKISAVPVRNTIHSEITKNPFGKKLDSFSPPSPAYASGGRYGFPTDSLLWQQQQQRGSNTVDYYGRHSTEDTSFESSDTAAGSVVNEGYRSSWAPSGHLALYPQADLLGRARQDPSPTPPYPPAHATPLPQAQKQTHSQSHTLNLPSHSARGSYRGFSQF